MNQDSHFPSISDRGELSLVRRLFRALGNRRRESRRTPGAYEIVPAEFLEVRQVLSGQPISDLGSLNDASVPTASSDGLTLADVQFVSSTLRQVTSALQSYGWPVSDSRVFTTNSVPLGTSVDFGLSVSNAANVTGVVLNHTVTSPVIDGIVVDKSLAEPAVQVVPQPQSVDTPVVHENAVSVDPDEQPAVEPIPADSPPLAPPAVPPQQLMPVEDGDVVQNSTTSTLQQEPASGPQVGLPRDLTLLIRFDWSSDQSGLAIQQPNDSTLLITVRGPNSDIIPEARRQLLQDSISKATAELVQTISAGTDARISLFTDFGSGIALWRTDSAASQNRSGIYQSLESSGDSLDRKTPEANEAVRNAVASHRVVEALSLFESGPLDLVFESFDGLLTLSTLADPVNPWILPLPLKASEPLTSQTKPEPGSAPLQSTHLLSSSSGQPIGLPLADLAPTSHTLSPLDLAIDFPPGSVEASESESGDIRKTTTSRALLKLLFAQADDVVMTSDTVLSGTPVAETSSQSATPSRSVQAKRERQSQRDLSAAVSLWRDSDQEQPPIPMSDGSPREVQFADRSRGPPLLRSARDDLLTDYEAPAGLLERLRYSISPRGPSLVTVDVQLPETVLFGAES